MLLIGGIIILTFMTGRKVWKNFVKKEAERRERRNQIYKNIVYGKEESKEAG